MYKAYDTVLRNWLSHVMGAIGVPSQSVHVVRSMYTNLMCQVKVEGCAGPEYSSQLIPVMAHCHSEQVGNLR